MTAVAQFPQGIDHPLVTVRNHAEALELYRKMGFAPSPISYHPWGSVTSLMMFPSNFIELIGVDDASKFGTNSVNGFCFGRQLGQCLDRGEEGVSLVALHSKDADADHARIVEAGLESQGRIDFRQQREQRRARVLVEAVRHFRHVRIVIRQCPEFRKERRRLGTQHIIDPEFTHGRELP